QTLLAEPFGQHLWLLSAVLSASQVEPLHFKASVLYKETTNCCKNQLERSTDPNIRSSIRR
ncbi:hypothetical protein, partial [Vibrio fujianensis]|uniref:hypothetical protein n=1 Tax=Vibrio fujianensis TaxID=1974215 RepID=UPI000C16907C